MSKFIAKQYGFTPSNLAELVEYSGLSNADFMRLTGIKKGSFYKYKNGDITMSWHNWQRIKNEVEQYLSAEYQLYDISYD